MYISLTASFLYMKVVIVVSTPAYDYEDRPLFYVNLFYPSLAML